MKKQAIILLAILTISFNSFSQENENTLIVEGKGIISIEPELARFLINFESADLDYSKCVENSLLKIQEAKELLAKSGIQKNELTTLSYTVEKNYKYNSQKQEHDFLGYKASVPLLIEIKLNETYTDKVFEILNEKLQTNYNLSFELSNAQMDSVRNDLIKLAIKDAKEKAKSICNETDIKIGKILKIQYGEPTVISNFIRPGYELLHKGESQILLRGTRSIQNTLTPNSIEMKTNIVIGWEIKK